MAKTPKIIIQKANAFRLDPNSAYLIHLPECTLEESEMLRGWLAEHGITDAVIVNTPTMQVNEMEKKSE